MNSARLWWHRRNRIDKISYKSNRYNSTSKGWFVGKLLVLAALTVVILAGLMVFSNESIGEPTTATVETRTSSPIAADVVYSSTDTDDDMVRIVVISDTHLLHDKLELPPGDVLVHCGDFTNRDCSLDQVHAFRAWFQNQTQFTDRVIVGGNHEQDWATANPDSQLHNEIMQPKANDNYRFLQDETIEIAGGKLRLHGCSWETCQGDAFVDRLRSDINEEPVDILLAHMPAYWQGGSFEPPRGSHQLLQYVLEKRIPLNLGGHFHWARGATQYQLVEEGQQQLQPSSWFFNAANKLYDENLFPPVLIHYNPKTKSVAKVEGFQPSQIQCRSISVQPTGGLNCNQSAIAKPNLCTVNGGH